MTNSSLKRHLSAFALSMMLAMQTAQAFTISQVPAFVPSALPPNIVITLDDSGSMRWGYAPDGICAQHNTRRAKSADFNPIYYNPRIRYDGPPDANGVALTTTFTAAWHNGFDTSRGSRDLSTNYQVTWAFDPTSNGTPTDFNQCGGSATNNNFAENAAIDYNPTGGPDQRRTGVPAYYYVFDKTVSGCPGTGTTATEACYRRVIVGAASGTFDRDGDGTVDADERQNFANWYSFYRTRNLLTVSAAAKSFQSMPEGARMAWQSLNTCNASFVTTSATPTRNCTGVGGNVNSLMRLYDTAHKANFYKWLFRLPANGGTPLRAAMQRAGEYYRTSTAVNLRNTPYAQDPQVTTGTEVACRPNAHILMTDGVWNESDGNFCSGANCGNTDRTARKLPDGTDYSITSTLTPIYRDASSNTLSDVAFYYWATDLRPTLDNLLPPFIADRTGSADQQYWNPKNDPATWQHMVNFTVGLGLKGTLVAPNPAWDLNTYGPGGGYPNLLSGAATWPAASSNASPGNVYDLWHAAINSRGQAFNAENPAELVDALEGALRRIESQKSAAASLATNSTRIATETLLYQARFNSGDWSGEFTAFRVNSDGSKGAIAWDATAPGKIPAHGSRSIYSWSGSAGINFTRSDLDGAGLWSPIGDDELLAYLRGDTSREVANGGSFRNRGSRLGDIVNSDPVFVGAENYGYTTLPEGAVAGATPYDSYVSTKNSRRKMVYVGANDGMLHAFDALTGEERFAYVPQAVIPNLKELKETDYSHRFYVDGSPIAIDAFLGSSWRTVLVGSTGAGGKSMFALDVTDPDAFGTSKILWEINSATPFRSGDVTDPRYDQDLGFTLGQAQVFKLNNGEWAAIFGNGYRSNNERAVLYVVKLSDGTLMRKIDTGVGNSTSKNGLGTPTLYDANGDDVADYAYAADMLGNVWKFDLTSTSAASWSIAFSASSGFPNGSPLFQARNAAGQIEPIQGRLELARPPSGVSGVLVLFGTGRFLSTADKGDTTGQSFYGILDNGTRVTATDRSTLQAQTISTASYSYTTIGADLVETTVTTTIRNVSQNAINWAGGRRGWYMDLPDPGERVIGMPVVRGGRVLFTTQVPSDDPCRFGGSGWLMQVDAATGKQQTTPVFDINRDKEINSLDPNASGIRITVGLAKQVLTLEGSPYGQALVSGTTGEIQSERIRRFVEGVGRESWREVGR